MRFAFVAAAAAALTAAAYGQEPVKVGSHPKYQFTQGMVNGQGVKSLADLEGRPVLVEFWGTH